MASIYRRKKGGCFYITYKARPGERKTVKGCKDRAATEAFARKLEADAMLRREGVIDMRAERLARSEALPLEDHLADFENAMLARGVTSKHLAATRGCIRMIVGACCFQRPVDLDPARVSAYVVDLRHQGAGARTINGRLTAFKAFTRWLFRTERMRTDPMMQVAKLNARTDRRRVRRALADDEILRLFQAAARGPAFGKLTGPDRALLYRLAVETGLRKSEIASLTPASFNLRDHEAATVAVAAAYSKHRRDDVVPLRSDLARVMAEFVAEKPADARLFRLPDKPADMLKTDLRRARAWWIREVCDPAERRRRRASSFLASRDTSNRVVDFHALRHTFITRLARSGVTPAVAKSLARHSTIVLTMDYYTHILIEDERAGLDRLPALRMGEPTPGAIRTTGT
jgi:site-specific recombinase XerD